MTTPARFTVRVPATTANLGPGFDTVGVALTRFSEITIAVDNTAERPQPSDRANAPVRRMLRAAMRAAFRAAHRQAPQAIELDVHSDIPIGRGLGVSAAARAAGLVAANHVLSGLLGEETLLELGAELEGHADNIAPALFGGLQVVAMEGRQVTRVPVPQATDLRYVGFTPEFSMPTHEGRALLPDSLSREDAVHNTGRSALLVAALATGRWEALETATDDRLHQRPRSALFPQMFDLFAAAKAAGAHAAYLSGGGSTLMALAPPDRADQVSGAFSQEATRLGIAGETFVCELSEQGATVLPDEPA